MKISYTQSHNGVTVAQGILKLMKAVDSEKAVLSINKTRMNPIIISDTEEPLVGDDILIPTVKNEVIDWADHYVISKAESDYAVSTYVIKVLVLSENFSHEQLEMIIDGKLKDGDKVMVECEESFSAKCLEPDGKCNCGGDNDLCDRTYYYEIKLNSENHINIIVTDRQEDWCSLFKLPSHYSKVEQIGYSGAGNHSVAQLEKIVENYKEVIHQLRVEKQHVIYNYNVPTKIK